MRPSQHRFNNYEEGPDFDRARSQIATPFQYLDIALDVAGVNQIFNVSGDFLYVDASSTGTVTLELNNQYNDPSAPFQVSAGFGLQALFKQLKLSWSAQVGKTVRLMYSTGDKVVPTNSTTISGSVTVNQSGFSYTASYQSLTAKAANTPDTVFDAAANPNGAIVWDARFSMSSAGSGSPKPAFLANAVAPVSAIDGDVICAPGGPASVRSDFGYVYCGGELSAPVRIPAGKGLYYISSILEAAAQRSVLYSLL